MCTLRVMGLAYHDNTIELPINGQAYNPFRLVQAYNVVLTNDVSTWKHTHTHGGCTYPYWHCDRTLL